MNFSWLSNLSVAALIAITALVFNLPLGQSSMLAWLPAGVAFAVIVARGRGNLLGVGVGLFAAALVHQRWPAAAATALVGAAAGYACSVLLEPLVQSKQTPRAVATALALGVLIFALPIALAQLGVGALVQSGEQLAPEPAPRVARTASGMGMSRNLALVPASPQAKPDPPPPPVQQLLAAALGVVLLAPAAWALPGPGQRRGARRGFARALAANVIAYAVMLWLAAYGAWPFYLGAAALPLCAGIFSALTLLAAARRAGRFAAQPDTRQQLEARDKSTGLLTRHALMSDLALAMAHARREQEEIALVFIDLHGCQRANDTFGHDLGDALLLTAAGRIAKTLSHRCSLYRLEADEFVVVAEAAGELQLPAELARNIIEAVSEPCAINEHELALGCCIGISLFPRDAQSAAELVKLAGAARTAAKQGGVNTQLAFSQQMYHQAARQNQLDDALRRAMRPQAQALTARDELQVVYQPRASLRSGKPIGLEALPCLHAFDGSRCVGKDLMLAAQRCGLVEAIGERVIRAVCAQLGAWRARGEALLPVAIALSSQELRQPQRLLEVIVNALHSNDLAAELLVLEVRDVDLAHDSVQAGGALRELDAFGVRVVADGFGAAHGTLTNLARLPLRGVALDASLLEHIDEPRAQALLRALIQMARTLQCSVLAKGVASEAQLARLREFGADHYQGALLSAPLSAQEIERFLAGQHLAFVASVGQVRSTR
jgi:diguanylate cyclase (GGDEF)-like protein